jgi:hypothetical protein
MDHTRPAWARHLVAYASGLSRIPDFRTAAWAGHGIGVVAGELSRAALPILAQAVVDYRAPLFVDSGAYGAFREGRASLVDHGAVMDRYDAIIDAIGDANEAEERLPPPLFVMPDTPGDQKATLRLVHSYRHRIENLLAFACGRPIIVLHTGPRRLSSVYRDLAESFGRDDFIVGVPSAAAALSDAAAEDLFAAGRPKHVHILGALSDRRLGPRLAQLDRARIALNQSAPTRTCSARA